MLAACRVLDLTDDRGHFAGLVLAQLGAEVIAVEPPGGHRSRRLAPFGPNGVSLEHWAYNRGKASVVLSDPGDLDRLAGHADVLIESGAIPVDLDKLRRRHPRLITASITPFGGTGPKCNWAATDLTVAAASGVLGLTGDGDMPPVRISEPQSWLHAAADAACGALIALHERNRSGLGQHVDVSAQESMMIATQHTMLAHLVGAPASVRQGGGMRLGRFRLQFVYRCADGYATVFFVFGPMFGPYSKRLLTWARDEGFGTDDLVAKNWVTFAADVLEGREDEAELDRAQRVVTDLVASKTKAELLRGALERQLLISPVNSTRDMLDLEQLQARNYWDPIEFDGRTVRMPGPFAVSRVAPLARLGAPRPLGADTARVLAEAAAEAAPDTAAARPAPSAPSVDTLDPRQPAVALSDVKILDLSWAVAGPLATRILADFGATVVRVESETRPDPIRGTQPYHGIDPHTEGSLQWHSASAGKLGVTLDLSTDEGRAVVLDLARWADVVVESFSPGTMTKWGLGYPELSAVKPDVIMVSSCLLGQNGPIHTYAGVGTMGAALAGFYPSVGWPDRAPTGPAMAYTDYTSPRLTASVILAALDHRRRTGQGQHIDFSQVEAGLHFLTTALLDNEVNGRVAHRRGNADREMTPHGVYPAAGDDRWVAIACETDAQWRALSSVIGQEDLGFLDRAERWDREAELDKLIMAWTSSHDAEAVQDALQSLGIPAHVVQDSAECVADPQLRHRRHFVETLHARFGKSWAEAQGFRLTRSGASITRAGPTFGEHNQTVLEHILGYDDERILSLVMADVVK